MIYQIQRHIFKRTLKMLTGFIGLLFLTFTLLDFCTKAVDITSINSVDTLYMFKIYGCEFIKKAHLFIPICFALAMTLQFLRMIKTKELVALLCAGISYKKVLQPFWMLGVMITAFLCLNRQYLVPPTRHFIETYRNDHVRAAKKIKNQEEQVFALILKDDSKLIYQTFDPQKKQYFDLYWIVSPQRILRIKYLDQTETGFKARFVDELSRNQLGTFQKKNHFKELNFSKEWLKDSHFDKNLPIQTQTVSQILKGYKKADFIYSSDEITTELLSFLFMSFSPLWLVALQGPLLTRYSRQVPVLFYVGGMLLIFFCTSTILDGFSIVSSRSIVSPWLLLFIPITVSLSFIIYRYRKHLI